MKRRGGWVKFGVFLFYWALSFHFRTRTVSLPHIVGTQSIVIEWMLDTMNGSDVFDGYRMSVVFAFWTTWKVTRYPCLQEEGPKNSSPLIGDFTWLEDLLITGNCMPTPTGTDRWPLMLGMDSAVSSPWGRENTAACPYLGLWDYNPPTSTPSIGPVVVHFDIWQWHAQWQNTFKWWQWDLQYWNATLLFFINSTYLKLSNKPSVNPGKICTHS